jgi:hypothetical protein
VLTVARWVRAAAGRRVGGRPLKTWIPLGVGVLSLALLADSCSSNGSTVASGPTATSSASAATTKQATATSAPKPKFATFHDGTHRVGTDIQAGTYRTRSGSSGCYFARLKGFGGAVEDILANDNTDAPAVVTILPTDQGFESNNCATWTADLSAITQSRTEFGDGDYIVGTDIQPGTYRNTGQAGCYWARLRGFGHTTDDVLANDNTDNPAVVTIAATDMGFESTRCGKWSLG